jgi:regulator of telomere elongation helicase 1
MPIVSINGIEVEFPKEPYSCQVDYMRSAIRAITDSSNALLESPTGTGKTLSLLCSTLAWQKHMRASAARVTHKLEYNSGPTTSSTISGVKAVVTDKNSAKRKPLGAQYTIVYASRTHSQLAQVVEELKCTNYRPRMTVLGSRDQLCIHDKISKLKAGALNHACNTLNSQRGCSFKTNLDKYSSSSGGNATAVMDIEEVKRVVGHTDRVCPYFYTREVSANADLVLLPYNYLLDNSIRATLKLDWQNSIVIFDEAHNLERVAADAVSFTLTSTDLAGCIIELQGVLKSLQEKKENGEDVNEESDNKATDKNDKNDKNDKGLSAILGGDAGGSPSKDPPTIQVHHSSKNEVNVYHTLSIYNSYQ